MRFKKIPKKSGGHRIICCPSKTQKISLRDLLFFSLNYKQIKFCDENIVHGFIQTKSVLTNAQKHIGFNFTFSTDIEDFFDSVKPDMVKDYLTEEEIKQCFVNDKAYQGLPTSPVIANLAAVKIDAEIKSFVLSLPYKVVYTRYCDDLVFSCDNYDFYPILKKEIPNILNKHGFKIKEKKNRLQDARYGLREVTGIMVGKEKLTLSKKFRKKLRAAKHQGTKSFHGLQEYSKMVFPSKYLKEEKLINIFNLNKYLYNSILFKNSKDKNLEDLKNSMLNSLTSLNTYKTSKIDHSALLLSRLEKENKVDLLKKISCQHIKDKLKKELKMFDEKR